MLLFSEGYYKKRTGIINLRALKEINSTILTLLFSIITIGLIVLYSSSTYNYDRLIKQISYFMVFLPFFLLVITLNIRYLISLSYIIYGICIALLIVTIIKGHNAMGATRWVNFKFFKLQPSEFMKIGIVMALARYYFKNKRYNKITDLIKQTSIIGIPFILILIQPDLGTAGVILIVTSMMIFVSGIKTKIIAIFCAATIALLPVGWSFMKNYQKLRIVNFFNPEHDPLGSSYNVIQSKIAIGSGGALGKGLKNGTQSQLNFLPEHQTDFIFTIIGEEMGFVGCITILSFFFIIILYGYSVSLLCKNAFSRAVSFGATSILFVHVIINISMTMGIFPAVGVPLPLISYGGSMVSTSMLAIALIINSDINKDVKL